MERWRSLGVFVLVVTAIYLYGLSIRDSRLCPARFFCTPVWVLLVSLALVVLSISRNRQGSGCWRAAVGFCLQRARLWAWR